MFDMILQETVNTKFNVPTYTIRRYLYEHVITAWFIADVQLKIAY